jgi:hypothetical protein
MATKKSAQNKTQATTSSVDEFLAGVEDPGRQADCRQVLAIMERATGETPRMWGPSIVGLGSTHYSYESGREGDFFLIGFSPRKSDLTLYILPGIQSYPEHLARLGKHKTGKSCLYLKRLADIDVAVLEDLIQTSVARQKSGAQA